MLIHVLLLIAGLTVLIFGADWLVAGASAVAKKMNVSDLAIGLTVVSFGTSAPEFVVNTIAAWNGNSDIVFGNVIGSNNFNLFLILGITGMISPLVVQKTTVWKEIPISFLAIVVVFLLVNDTLLFSRPTELGRIDGIILAIFFLGFLYYVYKHLGSDVAEKSEEKHRPTLVLWLMIIGGLGGLVLGGHLVVNQAVAIAQIMGVSEKIIGLTIIAAGTSLPELATSVVAALKKNNDIAVGNIIGSNIFNLFLILSASSIVKPIAFSTDFNTDLYILAAGTLFLFAAMFMSGKKKLDRWEASVLFFVYLSYTIYLVMHEL